MTRGLSLERSQRTGSCPVCGRWIRVYEGRMRRHAISPKAAGRALVALCAAIGPEDPVRARMAMAATLAEAMKWAMKRKKRSG